MLKFNMRKLSIVIPVFNEKSTIGEIVNQVRNVDLGQIEKEIIIVDDCSTDGTREVLGLLNYPECKIIYQDKNSGKGAALKAGFLYSSGDMIVVQDADLEYDPSDYVKLLGPILKGKGDVVYGSRFLTGDAKRVLYVWHLLGNKLLTNLSNLLNGLTFSDMETCYKVFTKEVLDSFKHKLESKRFGIEPEITARIAKGKWRIYEVGISYYGRTYEDGKKINWRDGVAGIWHVIKFNIFR